MPKCRGRLLLYGQLAEEFGFTFVDNVLLRMSDFKRLIDDHQREESVKKALG